MRNRPNLCTHFRIRAVRPHETSLSPSGPGCFEENVEVRVCHTIALP